MAELRGAPREKAEGFTWMAKDSRDPYAAPASEVNYFNLPLDEGVTRAV